MELPLVSIIVVSYNHSQFLLECLDSIKNQTYTNWELIVADDASPDDSVEVIKKWLSENNITAKTNFHTKNTGLAKTLNECVELCNGKYVKMLAADDFLHPLCFQKSVEKLEKLGNKYGMIFTDIFTVNNLSERISDYADYDSLGDIDPLIFRRELIKGNRIAALSVTMTAEALRATGNYENSFLAEDYYRWLKISKKYLIVYIPEKLAFYRLHNENISTLKKEKLEEEAFLLKMMFDEEGELAKDIRYGILWKYQKGKLTEQIRSLYNSYHGKDHQLNKCIQLRFPFVVYRIIKKLRLWQN